MWADRERRARENGETEAGKVRRFREKWECNITGSEQVVAARRRSATSGLGYIHHALGRPVLTGLVRRCVEAASRWREKQLSMHSTVSAYAR